MCTCMSSNMNGSCNCGKTSFAVPPETREQRTETQNTPEENGDEKKSWIANVWSGLWGSDKEEEEATKALEAKQLEKEAKEKNMTLEEYAEYLEKEGDTEKSSKVKQWIDDGTIEKAVSVLDKLWGSFTNQNPVTDVTTTNTPPEEDSNTGLYIGLGIIGLLLILGIAYFIKNKK